MQQGTGDRKRNREGNTVGKPDAQRTAKYAETSSKKDEQANEKRSGKRAGTECWQCMELEKGWRLDERSKVLQLGQSNHPKI